MVQSGVTRTYSVKMLETGTIFNDLANSKVYTDPIGIVAIETSETMRGHSGALSLLVGAVGAILRTRIEAQDCLRIEANTGSGWHCLFDGFVSLVSWSRFSSVRGFSWRLQVHAEGLSRIFQQAWLNWRMAVMQGPIADLMTANGRRIMNNLSSNGGYFTDPQQFIGMLLNFGVSDIMGLTGRDGIPIAINDYWQIGNLGSMIGDQPDFGSWAPNWHNAMGLQVGAALDSYLQMEGPLMQTITSISEPTLHEFFITYQVKGGIEGNPEIPTVVFRPIPFPGPGIDPAPLRPSAPGVSYPDDTEWMALPVLKLGNANNMPSPVSISASKNDGERKNMFVWAMSSALDGSPESLMGSKQRMGYWLDMTSLQRYGYATEQVTTSVFNRQNTDWMEDLIPRVLGRVAFQKAAVPYLWNHQRNYPLLLGSHPGMVLQDSTDGACGYINAVSHQIQAGDPGVFRAATTIQVERVVENASSPVTQESYPGSVRSYLFALQHYFPAPDQNLALETIHTAMHGVPPPASGFVRVQPWTGAMVETSGIGATRRCGVHKAVDYALAVGTPLVAPCDGKFLYQRTQVDALGHVVGAGNYVKFQGDDGSVHMFAHLSSFPYPALAVNQRIRAGSTPMGVTGISGHTTGPHLHWQILMGKDRILDPQVWIANGGSPL